MLGLYFISIGVAAFVVRNKKKNETLAGQGVGS
jgi:hypothetical protein